MSELRSAMTPRRPNPVSGLLTPFRAGALSLANRIVMAPMTRYFSPGGVPGPDVADYYARRAAAGVGLIVTEGAFVPHPAAGFCRTIPRIGDPLADAGWREVVRAVHRHGGRIAAQLWHVGAQFVPGDEEGCEDAHVSASGLIGPGQPLGRALDTVEVGTLVDAFAQAAAAAQAIGFDAIELHGGHGYLIDGFFWDGTNRRTDRYGGNLAERTRFACEIVRACRARTGPDFPIMLRFSQWKNIDYSARLATTPGELETFLGPLVDAGVDLFDCSTRRFWEPAFDGSPLGLAGWTRKLTGKPTVVVGSVGLDRDLFESLSEGETALSANLDLLSEQFARGEFDLVAIGRMLLSNPDWIARAREGAFASMTPFQKEALTTLV